MSEDKYSKEETRSFKIGLYTALVLGAIGGYFVLGKSSIKHVEDGDYYQVFARYNRTDGLLVGDTVRLSGMNVGKVIDAKLDDHFKAVLTLEIKEGIHIPDDSSASIVSSSILGTKYIEIEPGGSEDYIPAGDEFSYTQDAMVVEELLDRIVGIGKANRENQAKKCRSDNVADAQANQNS